MNDQLLCLRGDAAVVIVGVIVLIGESVCKKNM
jgi:hypothetical protein